MHPELAMYPEIAGAESLWRSRRSLHAFLLVSLAVHLAVIVGFPDLLRSFSAPGVSVLEVTLEEARPLPLAAAQPEPVPESVTVPKPEPQPRPDREKQQAESIAKPGGGGAAPGPPLPAQDPEIVGSFSVAPPRAQGLATMAPDPAAEAAAAPATPPSFDAAYLNNPPPRYPQAARQAGEQGVVTLRVLVMRTGVPSRVEIEKSSGYTLLDTAARDAVWGWRFVPGRQGTDPVEQWLQVPVRFRLEDAK